eukprot:TRINITY_DN1275_c0_g2_i1.p2 TRINITY_DN1275_c0_g2~~TRINITY_DN1275_c0_g2_i1.p2  ORF type:complete len:236 (-),score=36.07 TRINITY_DN1275_c0_g2_i1:27-734(-)
MSKLAIGAIALGWGSFIGSHLYMSHPPNRKQLIEKFGGLDKFQGLYSGIALATFVPTTLLYLTKGRNAGPVVHKMGAFGGAVGTVLNTAALFIFSQAIANQSPTQAGAKPPTSGQKKDPEVRGILRVTRHPMFTALGTWGLANCFKRGRLGDLVYWAPFPIFYIVGCAHQDMREKETLSENFYKKTSLLPFKAIIEGRNSMDDFVKEINYQNALIAFGVGSLLWLRVPQRVLNRK